MIPELTVCIDIGKNNQSRLGVNGWFQLVCLGLCQRKLANPIRVFLLIVYEITCFRILVLFSFLWVHLQKELTKCLRIPLLHALNSRLFSISIHACNKVVFLQQTRTCQWELVCKRFSLSLEVGECMYMK